LVVIHVLTGAHDFGELALEELQFSAVESFYLFIVAVEVVFTLGKRHKGGLVVFVNLDIWPRYPACLARSACDNFRNRDGTRLGGTDIRLELKLDANHNFVDSNKAILYVSDSFGELFYDVCDFVVGFPLEI
jgi:hypothetical protein